MDKSVVVQIHSGMSLSHEKERDWSFGETWMDLESITQSEVSQKEKNKYHMLMHICGI